MKNGMNAHADILFSFVHNEQKTDMREEWRCLLRFYSIGQ